ncbi:GNAT family N-acetyltransferase, partial [Brevibacterium paucivorans]
MAYFGTFAVSPEAQGSGVGKELMAYAESFA